ncbi:hypothetical protein SAMN05660652_01312 [Propionivibrio dicarboxylicus]|uniref:Uncharacterized protein n=2 Tax=Propionivibrio dicarboxylicus TaxID=83767 RepID=A0A1G8A8L6_9RHOO|nr:hypothetical protein SAMN05660652_01312 [Propionivibrio dicarboxylicus]
MTRIAELKPLLKLITDGCRAMPEYARGNLSKENILRATTNAMVSFCTSLNLRKVANIGATHAERTPNQIKNDRAIQDHMRRTEFILEIHPWMSPAMNDLRLTYTKKEFENLISNYLNWFEKIDDSCEGMHIRVPQIRGFRPLLELIESRCKSMTQYTHGAMSKDDIIGAVRDALIFYCHMLNRQSAGEKNRKAPERETWTSPTGSVMTALSDLKKSLSEQLSPSEATRHSEKIRLLTNALTTLGDDQASISRLEELAHATIKSPHDLSKPFLKSAAHLFLKVVTQNVWIELDDIPVEKMRSFAENLEGDFYEHLFRTREAILAKLGKETDLTDVQKIQIQSALEHAENVSPSFFPLLSSIRTQISFLANQEKLQGPLAFDVMATISESVAQHAPLLANYDHYLATMLNIGVAGLSPSAAQALLERLSSADTGIRQRVDTANDPHVRKTCDALLAALQKRSNDADGIFQYAFQNALNNEPAHVAPERIEANAPVVSPGFVDVLTHSETRLILPNGKQISFTSRKRPEFLDASIHSNLQAALALELSDRDRNFLLARLTDSLASMDKIVMATCVRTFFDHDTSGTLRLPDETVLTEIYGTLGFESGEARIVSSDDTGIRFTYRCALKGIIQAEDQDNHSHWLDPNRSRLLVEADLTLSATGEITLDKPPSCKADFAVIGDDRWPQAARYPKPSASNFIEVKPETRMLMLGDLRAFAERHDNREALGVIQVLEHIHAFSMESNPAILLKRATDIYNNFIKHISPVFLKSNSATADVLEKLYPHLDNEEINRNNLSLSLSDISGALEKFIAHLNGIIVPNRDTLSLLNRVVDLKNRLSSSDEATIRRKLEDLVGRLKASDGPQPQYQYQVETAIAELTRALVIEPLPPLSPSLFNALARELVRRLEDDFLPAFVEEITAQST